MSVARRHLTFSNLVACVALLLSLGGVSYAAITLPAGSVGTEQLQNRSVTGAKLASRSVQGKALSPKLRKQLKRHGAKGKPGAGGPQGPQGPGAVAINFSASATDSPTPQTILNVSGLTFTAACQLSRATTQLTLSAKSDQDAVIEDNFNVDGGTDPHTPGSVTTGNLRIDLPGGVETTLGGPSADQPNFFRVIATAIYTSGSRELSFTIAEFVDGAAGTCSVDGTAVPAS
jgi:hypothetical protein